MKHMGNICNINGKSVSPVDIISFGAPCQDLSVAGKRMGLKHSAMGDEETTRSGLFYEAIRIIKEMREATNDEYPKYAVYENVPGAFSSNKGHDFHAVLEAFCSVCDDTVSIPKPYDKKRTDKLVWNKAGEIVGDNYSIAWRTLDAQYWGVPQRRKRIYLVADFTGRRAGEILFKPESLRGNITQGDEAGEGATTDAVGSVDGGVGAAGVVSKGNGDCFIMPERHMSLSVGGGNGITVFSFDSLSSNSMKSSNPTSGCRAVEVAKCIDTTYPDPSKNQGGVAVVQPVIAPQANGIDRVIPINDKATRHNGGGDTRRNDGAGNGLGVGKENDPSPTVTAADRHAVCYGIDQQGGKGGANYSENMMPPMCSDSHGTPHAVCFENHQHGGYREGCGTLRASGDGERACYTMQRSDEYQACEVASTQSARQYKSATDLVVERKRKYIIRRLTPTECARLQGFPDWWSELAPYNPDDAEFWEEVRKTDLEIRGKKHRSVKSIEKWYEKLHTDSAEYKMWGNGIALPNVEYVLRGIAEHGAKTLGSLFDGSGGFPLAGGLNGIKPIWASEVAPYPIAVTKSRFKEVNDG